MCCHNSLLEDLSTLSASHVTPLGKDTWKLKPGFFRTLPHMPFPFADYDYVWRPVSPPSQSSNLAVVLGRHDISLYLASFQCAIVIPALPGSSLKSWELHNCPLKLFNGVNSLVTFSGGFPRTKINRMLLYILGCANVSAFYLKELPLCELQICQSWITLSNSLLKIWEFPGSLVVRTWCFHCRGPGSIPGRGTEIPQAVQCSHKTE